MTTYVLVHGAWGGSWGWRDFANRLRADGHEVYTPSLTGQGERTHLAGPDVNLATHIKDIGNVLFYEDLRGVVLVGHSYGGMVVTPVADRLPERIKHLVFIDAFLPDDGQSCFDLGGAGGPERAIIEDGWKVMPGRRAQADTDEARARAARVSPQPIGTLQGKVRLSVPLESRNFSLTYVKATGGAESDASRTGAFWQAAARTKQDPRWRYHELPCGHGVHSEKPEELKAILYGLT